MPRISILRPAACLALILGALVAAGAQGPPPIDDARLLAAGADAADWLMFGHDYTNQRFSALDSVTPANVRRLAPRWVYQTGVAGAFQATPLVADGVMYLTTSGNHVVALDGATGSLRWKYTHQSRTDARFGTSSNRGAALGYGLVFEATNDGRLIALDQQTGRPVWDRVIARPEEGETEALATFGPRFKQVEVTGSTRLGYKMPPLVYGGRVVVGNTGAGYGLHFSSDTGLGVLSAGGEGLGRRAYLSAHDAKTGAEIWRWYTTKADGWEGQYRATTPDGTPLHRDLAAEKASAAEYRDAWKVGGGSLWMTPAFDPELGLLYAGTGNPSPQNYGLSRPGDNLYTMSLVAIDERTGALRWYYQQVPHDVWGYDVASQPVLFDLPSGGGIIRAVAQASKTGFVYVNDRRTGELLYKSEPFVPIENLFAQPTPEGVVVAPGALGGADWSPVSYDPRTGLLYVAGVHSPSRYSIGRTGQGAGGRGTPYALLEATGAGGPTWGTLTAIDTRRQGRIRWQVKTPAPLIGGVLATGGGLVFMGEGNGDFDAFDSSTGERLWRFQTGAGVGAPPIAYSVGGTEYIAVASGGGLDPQAYPAGDSLFVFALPN